jgi:hypothetical protein
VGEPLRDERALEVFDGLAKDRVVGRGAGRGDPLGDQGGLEVAFIFCEGEVGTGIIFEELEAELVVKVVSVEAGALEKG